MTQRFFYLIVLEITMLAPLEEITLYNMNKTDVVDFCKLGASWKIFPLIFGEIDR